MVNLSESVMILDDKYIEYSAFISSLSTYNIYVKQSQKHFKYFHKLFTSPTGNPIHTVDYLTILDNNRMEDIDIDTTYFVGGVVKLHLRGAYFNVDMNVQIYEFYKHTLISYHESPIYILKKYRRLQKLDYLNI